MHEIGFNHWTGIGRICTAFKNMGSKKKVWGGKRLPKHAQHAAVPKQKPRTARTHSLPTAWHPQVCQKQAPIRRPFLASYRSSTVLPCALSQLLLMDMVTLNYPCSTSVGTIDATDIFSVPPSPASHLATLQAINSFHSVKG